jgi:hypothetical protein
MRTCEVEGCEKEANVPGAAKGLCVKHYNRNKRHGSPTAGSWEWGQRAYEGQHRYLQRHYGRAPENECAVCFEPAEEWAFIREWCPNTEMLWETRKMPHGVDKRVPYSLDEGHYLTLCRSHHRAMDKGVEFYAQHP